MIPFNLPCIVGNEKKYLNDVIRSSKFSGDGRYNLLCGKWLERYLNSKKALMTASGTDALEMAALILEIGVGDEVIMPSYTFPSTANAFLLRGAKVKFVDIRPDTMNINEKLIKQAITKKTKAIVAVHYAGVSCEMDQILAIAREYNLYVVEDAAQALGSLYRDKRLASIGDLACLSFHETKNCHCGEGGAIVINNSKLIDRAEIIQEKGTNRKKFHQGLISKYTWQDLGSSYLMSELNAGFLLAQLERIEEIQKNRRQIWNFYNERLKGLFNKKLIKIPKVPLHCIHNGHAYYIKLKDEKEREGLINYLAKNNIEAVFHYLPLHTSRAGKKYTTFVGKDKYTSKESKKILRLPLFYGMKKYQYMKVTKTIEEYFKLR